MRDNQCKICTSFQLQVSLYTRELNRIVNPQRHARNSSQHSKGRSVEMFDLAVTGDAWAPLYSTAL